MDAGGEQRLEAFLLAGDTRAESWIAPLLQQRLPAQAYGRRMLLPGAEPPAATPVLIGVTAPESCAPGARFNAILASYIEAARATAEAAPDDDGQAWLAVNDAGSGPYRLAHGRTVQLLTSSCPHAPSVPASSSA